ncbi:MAG: NADP-dependent phosphogluconate dehydrogenase [Candidatus Levybacteria bacterium]|nr:NADP-dependent phosphogluconate dehydrogenase [Candidatus Levybacteria bacterium]
MKLGLIGLGKMGTRMVEKLLQEGHEVVVWNRSGAPIQELQLKILASRRSGQNSTPIESGSKFKNTRLAPESTLGAGALAKRTAQKLKVAETIEKLVQELPKPRVVWLMVTAGEATETVFQEVVQYIEAGDVVIDGGNAFYKDTERRSQEAQRRGVRFLGIGVSGGVVAATQGYPLMVGGDRSAYDEIKPLFDSLAKPGGAHDYFGAGGAGHYVKMVHNAIEYGYMQAIGEGFGVLQEADYAFDLEKVARTYQKGTLISGFMMDRTVDALKKDPDLSETDGVIGSASGETAWTIEEAKKADLPIGIIESSYDFRMQSEKDEKIQRSTAAKLISLLRLEFGGHETKKSKK